MKTQLLSFTIFRAKVTSSLFAAALLFGSSAAFAQVKIGTNPTTIEPNSNLKVEASTSGRKMKVDKTTGQVKPDSADTVSFFFSGTRIDCNKN